MLCTTDSGSDLTLDFVLITLCVVCCAELPETATALAEHSFFEYQRLVQKEAEPELIIQLTNRPEELEDFRPPLIESEDASTQKDIEVSVTVAFAIERPRCGMFFHGKYGCTDNQVSILDLRLILNLYTSCI